MSLASLTGLRGHDFTVILRCLIFVSNEVDSSALQNSSVLQNYRARMKLSRWFIGMIWLALNDTNLLYMQSASSN